MIPYLVQYLLDEYEYRSCILILGGIILNICVAAALYRPLESSAPKVPKKPKRPRTTSQCSNRSLTFLADESGIGTIKNGSLTSKYIRNGGSNSKKNNNPKKKKSPNKNVKKGSSSVSKNEVKAILLENFLINNKQTDNLASPPRSRSRTISIDSSRILPDIPEVPEEHEDSHVTEMEKLEEEYNQCEKGEDPTYGNLSDETDLSSKNRMNENESDDHEKETLLNDAGCPSVSVSIKDNDCVKEPFLCKTEKATGNQSQELVSLHSCYGSVASIASLGPPGKDKYDNLSVLKTISKFFGLSCLKESIFYVLSLSFTCLIIVLSNYTMFVPTYGRTTLNLSKDDSAGLISIIAIASMLGRLLLPSMSDYVKIQKKHIYAVSCLVTTGAVASKCAKR